jgi:hypothetical protein
MKKNIVRKKLLEQKERKERLLTENLIVENRLRFLFEDDGRIINFKNLTESEKEKVAIKFYSELARLNESNLINEQFLDIMKNIFGNAFSGVIQGLVEPLVNSILSGLGLKGYFKDVLVSFFTKHPAKLAEAFKGCEKLTEVVASALVEGMVMMMQKESNLGGTGFDIIRNTLVDTMMETKFVQSLSDSLESFICDLYNKFTGKAKDVYQKLKPDAENVLQTAKTGAQDVLNRLQTATTS